MQRLRYGKNVVIRGFLLFLLAYSGSGKAESNDFGRVTEVDLHYTKDGVVEHIVLFPQENADSDKRLTRKGMFIRYPNAQATVVICHGFMCDRHDVAFLRKLFPRGKFNILTFDFRAHGEDTDGQCCTFGHDEAHDVIAAAQFVRSHSAVQGLPVYVYGFSMGAVSAIQAQERNNKLFDAMVLDCPFASSDNIVKKALANLKVNVFGYEFGMPGRQLLEKYAFHPYVQGMLKAVLKTVAKMDSKNIPISVKPVYPIESVKKITVPCFFIHCKNDDRISPDDVIGLYNAVGGYKRLWITKGRHHYDSFFYNPEKYITHVRSFISDVQDNNLATLPDQEIE